LTFGARNPRRVMVGTDRSETAEQAVRWAASFADRFDAELYVVQVIVPEHPAGTEHGAAERSKATAKAEELVRHAQTIAGERGRGRIIVDEDPAFAIIRAAQEDEIDVLVVGNAGMSGRKEFLLGNVPNRISHNARCTVIIVNTLSLDGNNAPLHAGPMRSGTQDEAPQPRRIARGSQIAAVFAKHGLRELFGQPDEEGSIGRRRQAKRLRAALEELGPTFAKLGQLLSTRPDLLPRVQEFVGEGLLVGATAVERCFELRPNLDFDLVLGGRDHRRGPPLNHSRLLVHPPGSWAMRPEAASAVPNLCFAADYVRTHTDIASMEGACEAGRRAANAILEREGSPSPRTEIWPLQEPSQYEHWKRLDADLFRVGRPHVFEIAGIRRAFDAANLLRRFSSFTGLAQVDQFLNQFKLTNIVDGLLGRFGIGR
jgi:nucleotide-binding universal stress UspA family protein